VGEAGFDGFADFTSGEGPSAASTVGYFDDDVFFDGVAAHNRKI
jgi:hypothetical protein